MIVDLMDKSQVTNNIMLFSPIPLKLYSTSTDSNNSDKFSDNNSV